jgi:hypothetical protein
MVINLLPYFLTDEDQYRQSEQYWVELWQRIDRSDRDRYQWSHPWLGTGSPAIKDGNPIFSAYSPVLRRGIRIVQQEPIDTDLDIQAYPDSFGGPHNDPAIINELVIACTLSDEAAQIALRLMRPWVAGGSVPFEEVVVSMTPETPRDTVEPPR